MTGEEKTKDKTRQDKRREKIHFQCGGVWPFFVGVVIFWLIPFAHVSLACYTVSSTIHFQFFNFCEFIFLCSYSFHFFLNFFCLCSYSFKFFRIIYLCSYSFFLPELILHKYSVEGYASNSFAFVNDQAEQFRRGGELTVFAHIKQKGVSLARTILL